LIDEAPNAPGPSSTPALDPGTSVQVLELDAEAFTRAIPRLVELSLDAIAGGASINFLANTDAARVEAWWDARTSSVAAGLTSPFVAVLGDRVVGCTLLVRSGNPNSPHRAEIGKVIVDRTTRRRGIATALMLAAETRARADGRWMLVLDTVTGSPADALYRSLGWNETGVVPDYALNPDGQPEAATFFWKDLR
jgi:ribosomal protein S18 acetylase RimI-like enzyme